LITLLKRDPFDGKMKMSLGNEVKREVEGKLSKAYENEKYLYSRVMELEKRNQKLETKVRKLKKKKKELKEEVIKLRRKTVVQHLADDHDASTSDVEIIEEPHFGTVPPSHGEEEQAVNDDVIGNSVDETTSQSKGADQEEESRESSIEGAAEMMEVNSLEEIDEEAVDIDSSSGTASSDVPNQCPQCSKGFNTPGYLSTHIKVVHGPKKECSYCHKIFSLSSIKRHIREVHTGDTRECPECKKQIRSSLFSEHMQVVHSGIKEKCPRCGEEMSIFSLKKHIKVVHDNVRKHCPLCPKMFPASNLKRHVREVHHGVQRSAPHASYTSLQVI